MVKYASALPRESIVDVEGTLAAPEAPIVGCSQSEVRPRGAAGPVVWDVEGEQGQGRGPWLVLRPVAAAGARGAGGPRTRACLPACLPAGLQRNLRSPAVAFPACPVPPRHQVELHVTSIRCVSRASALPFEVTDAARSAEAVKAAAERGEVAVTVGQVRGWAGGRASAAFARCAMLLSPKWPLVAINAVPSSAPFPPLSAGRAPGQPLCRPAHPRQPGHLPRAVGGLPGAAEGPSGGRRGRLGFAKGRLGRGAGGACSERGAWAWARQGTAAGSGVGTPLLHSSPLILLPRPRPPACVAAVPGGAADPRVHRDPHAQAAERRQRGRRCRVQGGSGLGGGGGGGGGSSGWWWVAQARLERWAWLQSSAAATLWHTREGGGATATGSQGGAWGTFVCA